MKICPKCGKVLSYNSYFGGYLCTDCRWIDISIGKKRNKGIQSSKFYAIRSASKKVTAIQKVLYT